MNRKLLAAAVAGAFALPGAALSQSTVQIYGNMNVDWEGVDGGGNAGQNAGDRNRVTNPGGTKIGFKGSERLGSGLTAWFQVESNIGGTDGTGSNVFGSRNSAVGLTGGWGTFLMGNWDSPYKTNLLKIQPFGATSLGGTMSLGSNGDTTNAGTSGTVGGTLVGGTGFQTIGGGNSFQFERRLNNTVQYHSPNLSGFSARIAYEANEGKTQGLAANVNPYLWSIAAAYENGPLFVGLSHERHEEFTRAGGQDTGTWFGVQYSFPMGFQVGFAYEKLKYETGTAAAPTTLEAANWLLHGVYRTGPHRAGISYHKAKDTKGTLAAGTVGSLVGNAGAGQTGAKQWTLEYGYSLSKRTEVVAAYSRLDNDANAIYDFAARAGTAGTTGDRSGYRVGFRHAF